MSDKTERRQLKFDCLRDSVAEVRRLDADGYAMAGNWDLGRICQHLTKTLRMSIEGASFGLPFFLRPVARWILFDKVMTGRPTRLPLKTLPQFLPDDTPDVTREIADYAVFVNKVLADDVPLLDQHPVFGRISADEWRRFHAWHAAHHLSHLIPRGQRARDVADPAARAVSAG